MQNNINNIDKELLSEMLDNFSRATGLYIDAINTFGESFLYNRECENSEFCKYIKENENRRDMCKNSYKKACKEAHKWNEPYFFKCHAGLVMWSVPIVVDEVGIGAIVCGQVLLWKTDDYFFNDLKKISLDEEDFETLKEKSNRLNVISAQKSQSVANMLSVIINYLIKSNNQAFLEQKNIVQFKKNIADEIEERKRKYKEVKFDYSVYLKREKKLLQYIRMGNKEKIINLLPTLFTDIEILCMFDVEEVKSMGIELTSLVSRAAVEGGVDSDICIKMLREMNSSIRMYKTCEGVLLALNKFIIELIDMIYILSSNNHISVLKSAKDYIEINYKDGVSIDDIAQNVFISTSYLSHLFKDKLNCTVNDYVTRVRIEKSVELMKKRELTVNDIMKEVGFSSQSHFTKTFKKIIGVTPGQYRNKFL